MSDTAPLPARAGTPAAPAAAPRPTADVVGTIHPSNDPATALPWFLRALDLLVSRQAAPSVEGLPVFEEAWARSRIVRFVETCVAPLGDAIDASLRRMLDGSLERIAQEPLRWPLLPVHTAFTPGDLRTLPDGTLAVADSVATLRGPIVHDIASLLRGGTVAWEEGFVLDVTVRYWERARKAGLPVDADFGAFYRGVEWMGLLLLLGRLGALATPPSGAGPEHAGFKDWIRLSHATASRYIELKPLQRVLERISGTAPASGFAFGRV